MAGVHYKQDMAPPGGYKDIYWKRTTAKTWFTAWKGLGLYAVGATFGYILVRSIRKRARRGGLEDNDVRLACSPFMMAERDRRVLRMWREIRALETEVMKDVPGWKTGTWYGEPIYFTHDKDTWWDPSFAENFAHSYPHKMELIVGQWNRDDMAGNHWYSKYMPEWYHNDIGAGTEQPYKGHKFGIENL